MPSTVLIITNEFDAHADAMVLELQERGVPVFRFHPEDFPHACHISLEIQGGSLEGEITTEYHSVALKDVCAAWYRRPQSMFPKSEEATAASLNKYVNAQSTDTLMALYASLDTFWVCNPYKLRRAEIKALQLVEASKAGFQTPYTLISNDPTKVSAFVNSLGKVECAVKTVRAVRVDDEQGYRFPLTTTLPKDYPPDSVVRASTIFQPYIDKAAELRCVVIGEHIFSAKINSQANEETKRDWRAGDCQYEPFSLPEQVEMAIHRLLKSFEINFASLDLILTPDGEFVFLELNPNGQWLWLEYALGFPLKASMADLLTSSHCDR